MIMMKVGIRQKNGLKIVYKSKPLIALYEATVAIIHKPSIPAKPIIIIKLGLVNTIIAVIKPDIKGAVAKRKRTLFTRFACFIFILSL